MILSGKDKVIFLKDSYDARQLWLELGSVIIGENYIVGVSDYFGNHIRSMRVLRDRAYRYSNELFNFTKTQKSTGYYRFEDNQYHLCFDGTPYLNLKDVTVYFDDLVNQGFLGWDTIDSEPLNQDISNLICLKTLEKKTENNEIVDFMKNNFQGWYCFNKPYPGKILIQKHSDAMLLIFRFGLSTVSSEIY